MNKVYNTTWDISYPLSKPKGRKEPPTNRVTVENVSIAGDLKEATTNQVYRKRVVGRLNLPNALQEYALENIRVHEVKIIKEL